MSTLNVLCIDGSPRPGRTTSRSLADAFGNAMVPRASSVVSLSLRTALQSQTTRHEMVERVNQADVIVLAMPLYVDTVPATVADAFEIIHAARRGQQVERVPRLVAMVNAGFPEAWHCELSLEVCRHFAESSQMVWTGGLAIPMGALIEGRPLAQVRVAKWVLEAIELTAREIAEGGFVPSLAVEYAQRALVPEWLYIPIITLSWHWAAIRRGTWWKRRARPFALT